MTVSYTPKKKIPKNEKTMWKCVENKNDSLKCRARIHTSGGEIVKVLSVHSHPPDPAKIRSKEDFVWRDFVRAEFCLTRFCPIFVQMYPI